MRRLFQATLTLVAITFVITLTSCFKATRLQAENDTIACDRPGITDTMKITSDGKWKVSYKPMWVTTQKDNDSTLIYTINENRSRRTRVDSIILEARGLRHRLTIIEQGSAKYVQIDSTMLVFKPEGEQRDIKLGTDGCYIHVTVPEFIQFYTKKGLIHLSVRQNRTGDREGTIIITVDSLQRQIKYKQEMLPYLKAYYKEQQEKKAREQEIAQAAMAASQAPVVEQQQQATTQAAPVVPRSTTRTPIKPGESIVKAVMQSTKKLGNCRKCGGTGGIPDDYGDILTCDQCKGTGSY